MRLKHVEYFNETLLNVVMENKILRKQLVFSQQITYAKVYNNFYAEATCKIPSFFFTTDIVAGLFSKGDDAFITNSLRCLVLLLTTNKTK